MTLVAPRRCRTSGCPQRTVGETGPEIVAFQELPQNAPGAGVGAAAEKFDQRGLRGHRDEEPGGGNRLLPAHRPQVGRGEAGQGVVAGGDLAATASSLRASGNSARAAAGCVRRQLGGWVRRGAARARRPRTSPGWCSRTVPGSIATNPRTRAFCRLLGVLALDRALMPRMVPAYLKPRNDVDSGLTRTSAARPTRAPVRISTLRSGAASPVPRTACAARRPGSRCGSSSSEGATSFCTSGPAGRPMPRCPGPGLVTLHTGHVPFASGPSGFLAGVEPFFASCRSAQTA